MYYKSEVTRIGSCSCVRRVSNFRQTEAKFVKGYFKKYFIYNTSDKIFPPLYVEMRI